MNIEDVRNDYQKSELKDSDIEKDPINQFEIWFEFAMKSKIAEPNAMTLATSSTDGKPSARIVLLKGYSHKGFVFYTNYMGRKALEIETNPFAAIVIYWKELERQIRIEGKIEKVKRADSDNYFLSRPLESRISAVVSNQSQVVNTRETLEIKWETFLKENFDKSFPRPDYWGGYILIPAAIEFWQGRPNRLHDRILYSKSNGEWEINRLEP